jgi:integrase
VTIGRAMLGPRRTTEGDVKWWMRPSYFGELLELAEQTGRRVEAICNLQYSDVLWGWVNDGTGARRGVERIRWRPFKGSEEVVLKVSPATRATLEGIVQRRPGVGDHWLFPSPRKPAQPIGRRLATDWLVKAEELAGLPHLEGGSWHPWRRKWAIERKHWAIADVMRVGGWADERSLRMCYQLADDETMEAVINEPKKLMERKA